MRGTQNAELVPRYGMTEDLDRIVQRFMVSSKVPKLASEPSRRCGRKDTVREGMRGR